MKDFPDKIKKNTNGVATLCYDRTPEFKVHSSKGLAHNAIGAKKPNTQIALYELVNNEWVKTWEYRFPEICACGNDYSYSSYGRISNRYFLPYDWEGIIKDAPVVCHKCYNDTKREYESARVEQRERAQLAELQAKYNGVGHVNFGDLRAVPND